MSDRKPITAFLGQEMIFFDGGMGTMLQSAGLKAGELPELLNLRQPEIITGIHRQYYDAGCHVVTTNTFGANRGKMEAAGYSVEEIVTAAVNCAVAARQVSDTPEKKYIAMDIGPIGRLIEPMGDLSFEEAYDVFTEMAVCGEKAGADLAIIETMGATYEVKAAVLAVKENTSLPVFVTCTFDERGKLFTGADVAAVVALLEGLRVDAMGMNCGLGPDELYPVIRQMASLSSLPLLFSPNAGLPKQKDGVTYYDVAPSDYARSMRRAASLGLCAMGGCCGTTPEHIREMIARCGDVKPALPADKGITMISSYTHVVTIGQEPLIVGERINPTGKKRFKEALKANDISYILGEGIAQQDAGAQILDVNVGMPGIDEPAVLEQTVKKLQGVLDLPLQIDTSHPEAMERALRAYNGKPLINSVSGKEESMRAVFPLVKKYGGTVVGLALDDTGIPATAEERVAVAAKIISVAAEYGIDKKDIVIDGLTLTVSAEPEAAKVTLETIRRVKQELGVCTTLGVSNVSFGLPRREMINAAFYTAALTAGLDCGIINPKSEAMMNAYYSYRALSGFDEGCGDYIARYSASMDDATAAKSAVSSGMTLKAAIVAGLGEQAAALVREALSGENPPAPMTLIQEELIPALNEVGEGFEKGTVFLPQLLMSAEAAKAAFDVLKELLAGDGSEQKLGRVILATVKDDIHDIGKNIVKVLLENYRFDVLDLGRDVPPEVILENVRKHHIKAVGLSALMTTTVVRMAETIALLRKEAPEVRIFVGGAVLTEEYAMQIGADAYCRDAMASVRYCRKIFDC
ncbi:MAG: homocysteine S-methyltransferase family protein [Clostridia bacterium]|nr:homocysteine S-methyltransferase family protein [Clostridia bacterium]